MAVSWKKVPRPRLGWTWRSGPASPGEASEGCDAAGTGTWRWNCRESLSGYLADRVVSAWQIGPDAGSLAQAADEVNAAADGIRVLVQVPLERAATAAGVPQCPAEVEAGVIATFVTSRLRDPSPSWAR